MKYCLTIALSIIISAMNGQGLTNIEELIRFQNTFGFDLPNHTEKISNSVFEITGIPKEGDYLKFENLFELIKKQPEAEMLIMFDKLNFPLAIHACETLRKKENGKWVFVGDDDYWVPYIEIDDILFHPQSAYHLYQNDFKDDIYKVKEISVELDSMSSEEAANNLSQILNINKNKLDFSEESLKIIDTETEKNISKIHDDNFYISSIFYVGEVFIKKYGGKWVRKYTKGHKVNLIELETGQSYDISSVIDFGLYDDEYPPYSAGAFHNQMPKFLKKKN
jgi:hypothetical protein